MTHGFVEQINISPGGVPKLPIAEGLVGELGVAGDSHNDKKNHGGPDRALCLWSAERIDALKAEGHPIAYGSAGENLTLRGLDWDHVIPGARLRIGDEVEAEVTRYTTPCKNNAAWFIDNDFTRMLQTKHPGWSRVYARVLSGGTVRTGHPVVLTMPAAARG